MWCFPRRQPRVLRLSQTVKHAELVSAMLYFRSMKKDEAAVEVAALHFSIECVTHKEYQGILAQGTGPFLEFIVVEVSISELGSQSRPANGNVVRCRV